MYTDIVAYEIDYYMTGQIAPHMQAKWHASPEAFRDFRIMWWNLHVTMSTTERIFAYTPL